MRFLLSGVAGEYQTNAGWDSYISNGGAREWMDGWVVVYK
jgi:hypothetical protein